MGVQTSIPIIPSEDLQRSLRLWVEGLGFAVEHEMRDEDNALVFCMLRNGPMMFMLNQRAGDPRKPADYEGIRLYWAPSSLEETRRHLAALGYKVTEIIQRDYGQSEFFLTDDDGFSHCFGVPTAP